MIHFFSTVIVYVYFVHNFIVVFGYNVIDIVPKVCVLKNVSKIVLLISYGGFKV